MIWQLTNRNDPYVRGIADRHYNRQKVGSPGFAPPGRALVLRAPGAFWITAWPFAEYVAHRWAGMWVCTAFRREDDCLPRSSDMIRDAIAATRYYKYHSRNYNWYEHEPRVMTEIGVYASMVTFVNPTKVRHKRDPGRCFKRAGFVEDGTTASRGLLAFVLPCDSLPEPARYIPEGPLRCLTIA